MTEYIGILDGAGSVWGVRIHDLPGCHRGGPTAEAAIVDAVSAARSWAAHFAGMGAEVPVARALADGSLEATPGETVVVISF